jgi:DNA-directed RNA polymerase subunit omega
MMLKPSIDNLLDKVDSKYSLVILESKRAKELRNNEKPTMDFTSVKPTQQALEEIADGSVTVHGNPDVKREVEEIEAELIKVRQLKAEKIIEERVRAEQEAENAERAAKAEAAAAAAE